MSPAQAPTAPSATDLARIALKIRRHILMMTAGANSGHASSSLSAVELVVALHFKHMRLDPLRPDWPDRDRFLLSKGHAAPVLYAALAERGYFSPAELSTFRRIDSRLQGHPTRHRLPGVEIASGSLGQGLSQGVGMALAGRLDGRDYRVYVMLGDGELQEGQNWEAAMAGAHYRLDRLCAIVDYNGLETDGPVEEIMGIAPLDAKWRAFNWSVHEIDGHDFDQIDRAIAAFMATRGRPTAIIAHTVKGKGVSFMENVYATHGVPPKPDELQRALAELDAAEDRLQRSGPAEGAPSQPALGAGR